MPDRLRMSDRRGQLVEAALAVAERQGLAAVTVREVAAQAGVALGVVHYCFADKDELLSAMAERLVRDLRSATAVPVGGGTLHQVLLGGVRALWRSIERTAGRQLLTYEITVTALRQSSLAAAATRQYAVSRAAVRDFLEAAAGASGATWQLPVDQIAGIVLAQLDGAVLRYLVDGDARTARRNLEAFVKLVATLGTVPG